MDRIHVGFIGCGRISDLHYRGYRNSRHAKVYAVCDTDEAVLAARKRQWKAEKTYTDYRELLADPRVDAVEILSPTAIHETMTIDAIKANKHVALQKTMTTDLASADRIMATLRGFKGIFKVSDNYVFYPPVVLAKKMIDAGEIGEPHNLRIKFIMGQGGWPVPPSAWEWRVRERSEGRPFNTFDHGHHLWAVAVFLQGEMERVTAWISSIEGMVDSPAVIMWQGKDATRFGVCDYANAKDMTIPSNYYANDEWFEITGTRGIIQVHRCTGLIHRQPVVSLFNGNKWKHYSNIRADWADGFIDSTKNFIAAIRSEEAPLLSASQGREILKFDCAIQRSNLLQRPVYLDELESSFPTLLAWRRRRRDRKSNVMRQEKSLLGRFVGSDARYAAEADALTKGLMERFDPDKASGWTSQIGLRLSAEGTAAEAHYSLVVKDGVAVLTRGALPGNPVITLTIPAGTWAAILLKKKRIEMALIQGKIKIEGKAEEALKLREVFKI